MRNSGNYETLLRIAREALQRRLPPDWLLLSRSLQQDQSLAGARTDAVLELKDPEGNSALVRVEIKRQPLEARLVGLLADTWRRARSVRDQRVAYGEGIDNLMVVSPYLGQSARERLAEEGISFVDLTGNLRFALSRPAVFIETQGANKNPWRENVPLRSLRGRGTARVVRALLDYQPPFGVREIAGVTQTSAASVSRVADLLEREAILTREVPRGGILTVDWERLLRRWVLDYAFSKSNDVSSWLEPRGTRALLSKLREAKSCYAITGSFASTRFAPVAEPRLVAVYVNDPEVVAEALGLRPADTGGNVLLALPFDAVVFDRTVSFEGVTYVSVTQVAIDLLTGPGRGPAEAESLIKWMRENEHEWRISLSPSI